MTYGRLVEVFVFILAVVFWGYIIKLIVSGILGKKSKEGQVNPVTAAPASQGVKLGCLAYGLIFLRDFAISFGLSFILTILVVALFSFLAGDPDSYSDFLFTVFILTMNAVFLGFGITGGVLRFRKSLKVLRIRAQSAHSPAPNSSERQNTEQQ